jgi:hypothetical protein
MRIFASTVLRNEANPYLTGYLVELDWKTNVIVSKQPIPLGSRSHFWNSRGGNRGGRGITCRDGILYVATATSILRFDRNLAPLAPLDHPWLAGLHEIVAVDDGIWVTSTVHDLVAKIDYNGRLLDSWWGSECQLLQARLGYASRKLKLGLDFEAETFEAEYQQYCREERLHLNVVCEHRGGIYMLSGRRNAFVRIRPLPEQIVFVDDTLKSPHNGIITDAGEILVNNTQTQALHVYSLASGALLRSINTGISDEADSEQFARSGWQRGLAHLEGNKYLVGTSPAAVFEVDIATGAVGQMLKIDADVRHCIHGLAVVTDL